MFSAQMPNTTGYLALDWMVNWEKQDRKGEGMLHHLTLFEKEGYIRLNYYRLMAKNNKSEMQGSKQDHTDIQFAQ